ncbi:COG5488 Integral membrane protein [Methylophilaceae bacterium]
MAVANLGDKIIARPNNSLSVEDSVKLLAALAGIALIVALGFLHIGAWLVLPFAGLEIVAFAYAFHTVYLHADDFDSITIESDRVVVEKRNVKEITTTVFQRYWAQVNVRDVAMIKGSNGKCGLFISSHGNEVEFGRNFINDEQRSQLARDLRQKLKNIN